MTEAGLLVLWVSTILAWTVGLLAGNRQGRENALKELELQTRHSKEKQAFQVWANEYKMRVDEIKREMEGLP